MTQKFALTHRELLLAISIAVLGFILSMRSFILYLDTLNPLQGFIVYYLILYSALYILSIMGLTIFGIKISTPMQTLGLLLITMAFFITIDWESPYINIVTKGTAENISQVYWQTEDGATWWVWGHWFQDVEQLRMLTYVLSPFLLTVIGGFLIVRRTQL
jgi:hypothetical protein